MAKPEPPIIEGSYTVKGERPISGRPAREPMFNSPKAWTIAGPLGLYLLLQVIIALGHQAGR